ncbi:MAG: hypothetical protein RLY83_171 [Actinomycetota bacterium]|jgi:hypothetical protein
MARFAQRESQKARLQVRLETAKNRRNQEVVILIIWNTGLLPARELQIKFDPGIQYHAVKGSSKYPFIEPNILSEIQPGEEIAFLLGPTVGNVTMKHVFTSDLTGVMSFKPFLGRKMVRQSFNITLNPSGFKFFRNHK